MSWGLPGGMVTGQIEPCISFNVQNGGRASVPRKSIIVRAAKYEVLDFGFHAADSGFPIIGLTWIQDCNRLGDSGVRELDFKRKTFLEFGVPVVIHRANFVCNDICKWLDFLVFSDKDKKP